MTPEPDKLQPMHDVETFVAAARVFRSARADDAADDRSFFRQLRDALAHLYVSAALLGPPALEEDAPDPPLREGTDDALLERLRVRFGELDRFVDVYDPSTLADDDVKPIERSLSFELLEVDGDIAEAVALLEGGHASAAWDVPWAFENHWGQHAAACLRPLHQIVNHDVG